MKAGLVGFDDRIVASLRKVYEGELHVSNEYGLSAEDADRGLVQLRQDYPNVSVEELTVEQFRILKADFDHYSVRRKLPLNHEEQHLLFLHILKGAIRFVRTVDALVFSNLPHQGADAVISGLAHMKGKAIFYLTPSIFEGYYYLSNSRIDFFTNLQKNTRPPNIEIDNSSRQQVTYMGAPTKISLPNRIKSKISTFRQFHDTSHDYPVRLFLGSLADKYWHRDYRRIRWADDCLFKDGGKNLSIYFPLHLQPELTTSCLGMNFFDQNLAIARLVGFLRKRKVTFSVLVKENPKQSRAERQFLSLLGRFPEIVFVAKDVSSKMLIQKSDLVATISGTAGWEAVKSGKQAIVFGTTWYESAPGVTKFDKLVSTNSPPEKKGVDVYAVNEWFSGHLWYLYPGQFDSGLQSFAELIGDSVKTLLATLSLLREGRNYDA